MVGENILCVCGGEWDNTFCTSFVNNIFPSSYCLLKTNPDQEAD